MSSSNSAVAVEPLALPIFCAECGGAVTIQMADWPSGFTRERSLVGDDYQALTMAEWCCPYCQIGNSIGVPGRMAWATRGHEPARTV